MYWQSGKFKVKKEQVLKLHYSILQSYLACLLFLLGDPIIKGELELKTKENTVGFLHLGQLAEQLL